MSDNIKIQLLLNILDEVTDRFDKLFELKEKLLEETNYKATHDSLTNLYNRNAFYDRLESLKDKRFCLAFIDLDNFKYVNDTFGHDKGDEILIHTAVILRENLKGKDLVGRIGGDEFLVAVKDCDKNCAKIVLENIENQIKNDFKMYDVSASIGGVIYPDVTDDFEELVKIADKIMYEVKENGKGRVLVIDKI